MARFPFECDGHGAVLVREQSEEVSPPSSPRAIQPPRNRFIWPPSWQLWCRSARSPVSWRSCYPPQPTWRGDGEEPDDESREIAGTCPCRTESGLSTF